MTTVSDDFNRANGGLGANWATSGADTWTVASNQCSASGAGGRGWATYQTALAGNDNRSEVQIVTETGGLLVRGNAAATTGYFTNAFGTQLQEVWKVVAGTATFLDSPGGITHGGAAVYTKVTGSTIEYGLVGGSSFTSTDTSITTGLYVGLASDSSPVFDNFVGSDPAAAALTWVRPLMSPLQPIR